MPLSILHRNEDFLPIHNLSYSIFRSHPPTPSVWYSHLASGSVRPSGYPSAQVLWRLDFPILRRVSLSPSTRVLLESPLESHVIPTFGPFWPILGPLPEPSAHHAIRTHPNSLFTIPILISPFCLFFKQRQKADISYRLGVESATGTDSDTAWHHHLLHRERSAVPNGCQVLPWASTNQGRVSTEHPHCSGEFSHLPVHATTILPFAILFPGPDTLSHLSYTIHVGIYPIPCFFPMYARHGAISSWTLQRCGHLSLFCPRRRRTNNFNG